MIDAGDSHIVSPWGKAVSVASADVDLSAAFPTQGYARSLYNGSATAADIVVVYAGDASATSVKFANVPGGSKIFGCFKTLVKTGTTATNIVAEQ